MIKHTLLRDCWSMVSRNRPLRISRLRITWKPSVAPKNVTACSVPPVTTLRNNACDVAATATTLGKAFFTASMSASVISSLLTMACCGLTS